MSETAMFMIEGGRALELVQAHIVEVKCVNAMNHDIANELGVTEIWTSRLDGALSGVVFPGAVHPDFTKPRGRGGHGRVSYPKKKTEWAQRISALKGYTPPSELIERELGVPCVIRYGNGECDGGRCIGRPFFPCGFLFFEHGPYAMWVPDVPAEVAKDVAQGYAVAEPAASFKLEFDGCRRIEDEEWEMLVLQHKLDQKKQKVPA